jgi:bifunctional DNA-binding transcriptional regulator/antitoxin component of YhaV-PrlF toxin-antitoxin module
MEVSADDGSVPASTSGGGCGAEWGYPTIHRKVGTVLLYTHHIAQDMTEVTTDDRGRVTIPKEIRERFGERYRLVELRDGVKLMPIPSDPVAALRSAASEEFRRASMDDIREAAETEARRQTGEHVR